MISVISCNGSIDPLFPNDVRCATAFLVGLAKQPVDTDSSQACGLASRFQESMNVQRGTGVSTAVTLHQSFFLYFTLVNNIILQNKVHTKIHLQLNKSFNEVEKLIQMLHNNFTS